MAVAKRLGHSSAVVQEMTAQLVPTPRGWYLPAGRRGGYRPSDQGREAGLAEAWRRRGQPADPRADGVAGPSSG
jgi:hypothetical protein